MQKLAILLFAFLLLCRCTTEKGERSQAESLRYSGLSEEETLLAIADFDSLIQSTNKLNGKEKYEKAPGYLNEALNIAKKLNNDSLLVVIYFRLGVFFNEVGEYNLEIDAWYGAYEIYQKKQDYVGCAIVFNNMSWGYIQALDYAKGITQAQKGLAYTELITDSIRRNRVKSLLYCNLALALVDNQLPDSALKNIDLALAVYPDVKTYFLNHYAWIFATYGNIYLQKKNYPEAEKNFNTVVAIRDSAEVADAAVFAISKYCQLLNAQKRYREAIKQGKVGLRIAQMGYLKRYQMDLADQLQLAYEKSTQIDSAYAYAKFASSVRDEIFNIRASIQLQNSSFTRDLKEKDLRFEIEKAQAEEKLKSEKWLRNIYQGGFLLLIIIVAFILYQRNKIKAAKKRSDDLLLNILPEEVAEELKSKGETQAKQFDEVTIMFTDFKGFTQISEKLNPQELVSEIHNCFKGFDLIMDKFNIEKIKTIGDSYMCAGGLPVANTTHAVDVVQAGLEIRDFMDRHNQERTKQGKEPIQIRIGIHTGSVVAGIVGVKKFAYDIWGDAVNTASRMESSGECGKVNVSGTTYALVKEKFICSYRGKIMAKNKGELDMYFVEDSIPGSL